MAVSSLEAIRKIFGVGELSYMPFLTELLMCIMIGLQRCPDQDIKPYKRPNNLFGLSLDKTDHVIQNRKRKVISAVRFDISPLILFQRKKGQETSKSKRSS